MEDKYFEIKIEGLKYGKVQKKLKDTDYKTAVKEYKNTQKKFNKVQCDVVLNEIKVEKDGKKKRKVQYKNTLGKNFSLELKFKELLKIIEEIKEIKKYHKEKSQEGTHDFNDIRHAIEIGAAEFLSPEQCKDVFMNISDKAAIRRASKLEMEKLKTCNTAISIIETQINKSLLDCHKIESSALSPKAKENAKIADEKYVQTLLSLCERKG